MSAAGPVGQLVSQELHPAGVRGREAELAPRLDYWRRTLRGAPAVTDLPIDWPLAAVQSFHGALHRFVLPSGVRPAATRPSHPAPPSGNSGWAAHASPGVPGTGRT
ncbi:hypothetical protein ACFYNL_10240 [Streptomyces sp. NPDC007808]|uniref:hypothetical protein n=1 Tax=Streptomyces sp. NPDC007808 TaxID=3364779 RepID=UPI0036D12EB8